eukprot:CAMPEP_0184298376 /NCGR_PEP_ID=MMETSP1049-20130417/9201_1 /TAXON_ID=77928 /ORGANISM="Proteomonas sulcata, Strain CCMP704" /LENGTH=94 /DNA_ID=CAMNT_0026608499 /DNA_START=182 /DNA_END=466 /DNA_ORIENTATION=-
MRYMTTHFLSFFARTFFVNSSSSSTISAALGLRLDCDDHARSIKDVNSSPPAALNGSTAGLSSLFEAFSATTCAGTRSNGLSPRAMYHMMSPHE